MTSTLFELFKQQEAFNQASFQGHFSHTDHFAEQAQDPSLALWLSYLAKKQLPTDSIQQLPAPYADCWLAWLAYNKGELVQALELFIRSFNALDHQRDAALTIDVCLGLGRLYTRTGYFHTARNWLLYAGDLARQHDRLYDTVRSFGAMGDLFLRAGHNQQALLCLNTAHQLLPPGAGERSRQMNYQATALMRLGTPRDQATAEELLMQSFYLAQDTQDQTSMLHSLARLQFLYLDRNQPEVDACQLLGFNNSTQPVTTLQHIPAGFLALGRSFSALLSNQPEQATSFAQQACQHLQQHPAEYYWARSLLNFLQADNQQLPKLELPTLALHQAPSGQSIINQQWQHIALDNQGIELFKPQLQQQSLLQHRQVFFL